MLKFMERPLDTASQSEFSRLVSSPTLRSSWKAMPCCNMRAKVCLRRRESSRFSTTDIVSPRRPLDTP